MFWRVLLLLLLLSWPLLPPNNTVDLMPGTGDPVAKLLFFCRSPSIVAISGLTCDAPDESGKSDIWGRKGNSRFRTVLEQVSFNLEIAGG